MTTIRVWCRTWKIPILTFCKWLGKVFVLPEKHLFWRPSPVSFSFRLVPANDFPANNENKDYVRLWITWVGSVSGLWHFLFIPITHPGNIKWWWRRNRFFFISENFDLMLQTQVDNVDIMNRGFSATRGTFFGCKKIYNVK